MRSLRYLNTILTLLTILMAMQLWTTWSMPAPSPGMGQGHSEGQPVGGDAFPLLVTPVAARTGTPGGGIPDAGAQRREMIDLLKRQTQQTEEVISLLKSGQLRVRVEAAPGK